MTIIFTLLLAILGIFSGLVTSNFSRAQSKAGDSITQSEVNSIHRGLELYYTENGYYPSTATIETLSDSEIVELLDLFDAEYLYDQNNNRINSVASTYRYTTSLCSPTRDNVEGCQKYVIIAEFNDGAVIKQGSLN